jgi:hypothetical protein
MQVFSQLAIEVLEVTLRAPPHAASAFSASLIEYVPLAILLLSLNFTLAKPDHPNDPL